MSVFPWNRRSPPLWEHVGECFGRRRTRLPIGIALCCAAALLIGANLAAAGSSISAVQGSGAKSPSLGNRVTVEGVVTALTRWGFFIQTPEGKQDQDPRTSEGLFLFVPVASFPDLRAGHLVEVSGAVAELGPQGEEQTQTALVPPLEIKTLATGQELPPAVTVKREVLSTLKNRQQLESLENMRVVLPALVSVSPSEGKWDEPTGKVWSNGRFWAVPAGVGRPYRTKGIDADLVDFANQRAPEGQKISRSKQYPELIRVDTSALMSGRPLDLTTGVAVKSLAGVLSVGYGAFTLFTEPRDRWEPVTQMRTPSAPVADPGEFTVGAFNVQHFYDDQDDPKILYDIAIEPGAVEKKRNKIALAIRQKMGSPAILALQEVETLALARSLADRLNAEAVRAGEADPKYQALLLEGNCPSGLDVAFLYKSGQVKVTEVVQVGKDEPYKKVEWGMMPLYQRPPLFITAEVANPAGGSPFVLGVLDVHFKSMVNMKDPSKAEFILEQRKRQAEFAARFVRERMKAPKRAPLLVIGDFNAVFPHDGLVDILGILRGVPGKDVVVPGDRLLDTPLKILAHLLPEPERYSVSYGGLAQTIDHALADNALMKYVSRFVYVRNNADFPDIYRLNDQIPERASDHDMPLVYLRFAPNSLTTAELRTRFRGHAGASGRASPGRVDADDARVAARQADVELESLERQYFKHYLVTGKETEARSLMESRGAEPPPDWKPLLDVHTRIEKLHQEPARP